MSTGEIRALFVACATDRSPAGAPDAALLALLYGAGMRRQEVVRLGITDFDVETGAVTIRAGKGRKDRIAYTSNGSLAALQAWVAMRGPEPGPLFFPVMKGGRMVVRRLIPHAIYKMVQQRAQQAGVKAFSPHDLRRSFVSDLSTRAPTSRRSRARRARRHRDDREVRPAGRGGEEARG